MAHEDGKVVIPTHGPPLPQEINIPGTNFCWSLSQPDGHIAAGRIIPISKIPLTPSGNETATFGLVALCLKPTAPPLTPSI